MSEVLKLSKPIPAVGGADVAELTFRELVGGDLIACGMPVGSRGSEVKSAKGFNTTDPEAVSRLISRLTGVPPSSVAMMSGRDFMKANTIVMGFLSDPADDGSPPSS